MKNSFIGILAYMGYINITLLIMYVYVALFIVAYIAVWQGSAVVTRNTSS